MRLFALSSANKEKSFSGLLFISGRRGLCLARSPSTCLRYLLLVAFSHKQIGSALGSLAQLAIKFIQSTISIHKKDPSNDESSLWSGRRGSNSRHPPWQGGILPLNYPRLFNSLNYHTCKKNFCKYFFCLYQNSILLCLYDQK